MTPLLLRPFVISSVKTMEPPNENRSESDLQLESMHFQSSSQSFPATIHPSLNKSTNCKKKRTNVNDGQEASTFRSNAPKIILHQTHPPQPSLSKHLGSYNKTKPITYLNKHTRWETSMQRNDSSTKVGIETSNENNY